MPTAVQAVLDPLRLANRYDLFGSVASHRIVWVLEGSHDGVEWHAFQPHTLPCALDRPQTHIAPWHHHLDFALWIGAFEGVENQSHWSLPLARRLLEGSPSVHGLFANRPFPEAPPRFLRLSRWEYGFAPVAQRRQGVYWWRRPLDEPAQIATLEGGKLTLVANHTRPSSPAPEAGHECAAGTRR